MIEQLMVTVSPLERGLRGVLQGCYKTGFNTPPAPSQEGKGYHQIVVFFFRVTVRSSPPETVLVKVRVTSPDSLAVSPPVNV